MEKKSILNKLMAMFGNTNNNNNVNNNNNMEKIYMGSSICAMAFGKVSESTEGSGEIKRYVGIGSTFILPATVIYHIKKKKSFALTGCAVGTLTMSVFGTIFNAVYLLPVFAVLFHTPLEELIAAGTAVNASINNITTFVCFAVAPLNLTKGISVSFFTVLLYKHISPILKTAHIDKKHKEV